MEKALYSNRHYEAFFNPRSIPRGCFMKCPRTFCCESFQTLQESRRFSVHSAFLNPLCHKKCKRHERPDLFLPRETRHADNGFFPASLCAAAQNSPTTSHRVLDVRTINTEPQTPPSGTHRQARAPPRKSQKQRQKRDRTVFTPEQLSRLEREFHRQQYIMGVERQHVASDLGLSERQVKVWYQNRRIKWRKQCHVTPSK